jgi:hypothetical protein
MDWEIISFVGMGPVKFGMSPAEVEAILGKALAVDDDEDDSGYRKEVREINLPTVTYEDGTVAEIEAFSNTRKLRFKDIVFFEDAGLSVLRRLEDLNGGARSNVGVVLFDKLGITTGLFDNSAPLENSVTAFRRGHWDDNVGRFKSVSFR